MPKFKLRTSTHSQPQKDGPGLEHFEAGDTVQSEHPLDKMFPNKFDLVPEEKVIKKLKSRPVAETEEEEEDVHVVEAEEDDDDKDEFVPVKSALGKDVTNFFEKASQLDFKVFKKKKEYFVAEADAVDVAINKEPLVKKDVDAFLDDYQK